MFRLSPQWKELFACIAIIAVANTFLLNFQNFPRSFGVIFVFQKLTILLENKQWWDFFYFYSFFFTKMQILTFSIWFWNLLTKFSHHQAISNSFGRSNQFLTLGLLFLERLFTHTSQNKIPTHSQTHLKTFEHGCNYPFYSLWTQMGIFTTYIWKFTYIDQGWATIFVRRPHCPSVSVSRAKFQSKRQSQS